MTEPKRLIICCDGTWKREDDGQPSNVHRVYHLLAETGHDGRPQRAFYQHGVGADPARGRFGRWWNRVAGGALGIGLNAHILSIYKWLIWEYEPGDELWFFGFSRGAYTARSTVGLLRNCGILRRQYAHRAKEAMDLYRARGEDSHPDAPRSRSFRRNYGHEVDRFEFLGIWDTVGSLGIPSWFGIPASMINRRHQFHDVQLSSRVRAACHAIAIDERRRSFSPTLWEDDDLRCREQPVEQVWFSGVHSDVGGGYIKRGLSDITLQWMMARAEQHGLAFDPVAVERAGLTPDWRGVLHDSRWLVHRIPGIGRLGLRERLITRRHCQAIHETAKQRLRDEERYEPANLAAAIEFGVPVVATPWPGLSAVEELDEETGWA